MAARACVMAAGCMLAALTVGELDGGCCLLGAGARKVSRVTALAV